MFAVSLLRFLSKAGILSSSSMRKRVRWPTASNTHATPSLCVLVASYGCGCYTLIHIHIRARCWCVCVDANRRARHVYVVWESVKSVSGGAFEFVLELSLVACMRVYGRRARASERLTEREREQEARKKNPRHAYASPSHTRTPTKCLGVLACVRVRVLMCVGTWCVLVDSALWRPLERQANFESTVLTSRYRRRCHRRTIINLMRPIRRTIVYIYGQPFIRTWMREPVRKSR